MNKLSYIAFIIILPLLFFVSCNLSSTRIDETFRVKVNQGELAVRIIGNSDQPLVINLHSGPGGSSAFDVLLTNSHLENYLVAYPDQRGCGKSSTCRNPELLTLEQAVEDLDMVIDSLCNRYGREQVNLIGTSWGGTLGFLYLLEHQEKINAFASIGGNVNTFYQNQSLINHEMKLASTLLDQDPSEKRETELLDITKELKRIQKGDNANFYEDILKLRHQFPLKLGFNPYYADPSKTIRPDEILADSLKMDKMNYTMEEFFETVRKGEIVRKIFYNNSKYNNLNIEDELAKIHTPVLIVQGEEDYIAGKEQAQKIYNGLINVDGNNKELHILPDVGHSPVIEAPDKFAMIVNSFFGKHEK